MGIKISGTYSSGAGIQGGENALFGFYTKNDIGGRDTANYRDVFTYDSSSSIYTFHNNSPCVPEPSTMLLFGFGIFGFLGAAGIKKRVRFMK